MGMYQISKLGTCRVENRQYHKTKRVFIALILHKHMEKMNILNRNRGSYQKKNEGMYQILNVALIRG